MDEAPRAAAYAGASSNRRVSSRNADAASVAINRGVSSRYTGRPRRRIRRRSAGLVNNLPRIPFLPCGDRLTGGGAALCVSVAATQAKSRPEALRVRGREVLLLRGEGGQLAVQLLENPGYPVVLFLFYFRHRRNILSTAFGMRLRCGLV